MKTGVLKPEEQQKYDIINKSLNKQHVDYKKHIEDQVSQSELGKMTEDCKQMGFSLDIPSGNISYLVSSFKPLDLPYDICYIRHGQTEGNMEPRVYQGHVDYPENQLSELGKAQASLVASSMSSKHSSWTPDLVILSPLGRAADTAKLYLENNKSIPAVTVEESAEMAFGVWDGMKVIDIPAESCAHLFYIEQNVVVKAPASHIVKNGWRDGKKKPGDVIEPENYIDVLKRMKKTLLTIPQLPEYKTLQASRPKVLMFGHSMVGAAVLMLMGQGNCIPQTNKLGFDGSLIMPNGTPTFIKAKNGS